MITVANKFYKHMNAYGVDRAVNDGTSWYPLAWDLCKRIAKQHDVRPKRVAAVMAVTSPRARWSANVAATVGIIGDHNAGKGFGTYGVLRANETKAIRIMTSRYYSNIITGPKVSVFYDALCGDEDAVTVDSIMSQAAGYGSDVSPRIREEVTTACWQIADVFGISPRDAQASVWCAYRRSAA
jgi:hypothetical protein